MRFVRANGEHARGDKLPAVGTARDGQRRYGTARFPADQQCHRGRRSPDPLHAQSHQVRALGLRVQARNDAGQDVVMPGALIGLSHTPMAAGAPATTRHPAISSLEPGWSPRPAFSAPAPGPAELPLVGLRVLNLGTIIAGPYVATLLGELGAEVKKVERPPNGDEFRVAHGGRGGTAFPVINRGHRSLLLDLTADRGRDVFAQLVRSADVVVDNYRVGVLRRLRIDHDALAAINPLVTSVSISAFGERLTRPAARLRSHHPGSERHHASAGRPG